MKTFKEIVDEMAIPRGARFVTMTHSGLVAFWEEEPVFHQGRGWFGCKWIGSKEVCECSTPLWQCFIRLEQKKCDDLDPIVIRDQLLEVRRQIQELKAQEEKLNHQLFCLGFSLVEHT